MSKPVSQQVGGSFGDHNGVLQQGPEAFTENIAAVCQEDFANGEVLKPRNGSKVLHDVKNPSSSLSLLDRSRPGAAAQRPFPADPRRKT
jgi:hypothetical protein